MLRRNVPRRHMLVNPTLPFCVQKNNTAFTDRVNVFKRESYKTRRYFGGELQQTECRNAFYLTNGGPKSMRIIISPAHRHRQQFNHPMINHDLSDIRMVKTQGAQYDLPGGYTRFYPSKEIIDTNAGYLTQYGSHNFLSMDTEPLVLYAEATGLRFIFQDTVTKPRAENFQYHRHKLYAHNFPWIKEPVTNDQYGDADYNWKGTEVLDYSTFGATTKDSRNVFRSLWRDAAAKYAEPPAEQAKPAAAETKKAAAEAKPAAVEAKPAEAETKKPDAAKSVEPKVEVPKAAPAASASSTSAATPTPASASTPAASSAPIPAGRKVEGSPKPKDGGDM